ncbi:MAG UNVERIFIED_CONTAM: hypothetical protein LVR29_13230 [Microcystis novacekii LVE1205-3]
MTPLKRSNPLSTIAQNFSQLIIKQAQVDLSDRLPSAFKPEKPLAIAPLSGTIRT